MTHAVVVGGGISGLAAARRLALAGLDVAVCEASARLGGKLAPVEVGGLVLDGGAESLLARRAEATALVEALGLASERVHPTTARPQLLVRGRTQALPPSLQGVPTDVEALRPLLSDAGAAYALGEPVRPAPPLAGDVTIGGYVDERFGREVTDRLLEPLLGGVYAGRSRRLSFAAVAPALYAAARSGGSLSGHARAALRCGPGGPVFAGLDGGVHRLVGALAEALVAAGVELRTRTTVTALRRAVQGFVLETSSGALVADAVVLAVPGAPTARLLGDLVGPDADVGGVAYASTALVTLLVGGLVPPGSGLLAPPGELPTVKALTYSSAKWAWVGETVAQAYGEDVTAVRVSVGRDGEAALLQVDDAALVARSVAEVSTLPGWEGVRVVATAVTRWGGALPQYALGHPELVARLRTAVEGVPGLAVAGALLDGVGVPACLASADAAVTSVLDDLGGGKTDPAGTAQDETISLRDTGGPP